MHDSKSCPCMRAIGCLLRGGVLTPELTCCCKIKKIVKYFKKCWKQFKTNVYTFSTQLQILGVKWHVLCAMRKNKITAFKNVFLNFILVTVFLQSTTTEFHSETLQVCWKLVYVCFQIVWIFDLFNLFNIPGACELGSQSEVPRLLSLSSSRGT